MLGRLAQMLLEDLPGPAVPGQWAPLGTGAMTFRLNRIGHPKLRRRVPRRRGGKAPSKPPRTDLVRLECRNQTAR